VLIPYLCREVQNGRILSGGTVHLYQVIYVQAAKMLWRVSSAVTLVCGNTVQREQIKATVTLWLQVRQSVTLGVEPLLGAHDHILFCMELHRLWVLGRPSDKSVGPSAATSHGPCIYIYAFVNSGMVQLMLVLTLCFTTEFVSLIDPDSKG